MTRRIVSLLTVCILLLTSVFASDERTSVCKVVRVGYFDFPGYHERLQNGEKSGYGYEYLQEIRKYANWQYEYVYAPYEECLKLLKAGEIDILTSVSYSEARDEFVDYCETPMGTKNSVLTVKSSNTKYAAGEYKTFDGIHVGMLSGNTSNLKFDEFSKKHGFSYTCDDSYTDIDTLTKALKNGEVEAIVTSNLRKMKDEQVIAEFAPTPYYAVVRDEKLLGELNNAMEKINIISPTYGSDLYQKYYSVSAGRSVVFSKDESEYIKNNPTLDILIPPSLRPMAYTEAGEVLGIEPDLIRKALEPSGLMLNLILFDSSSEYVKARENTEKYQVNGLVIDNAYNAEANNLRITAPYLTINYNVITKTGARHDKIIVAAVKNEPLVLNFVEEYYRKDQIRYYENGTQCVDAVLNGEATHTIMNSYVAEDVIENDVRDRLVGNTLMAFHSDFSISVYSGADYRLFSILNKCVNALSQDDARAIVTANTMYKEKPFSLIEYLYMYPIRVILMMAFLFAVIISTVILYARQFRLKKEQHALQETAHFAKIAAEANGEITEINMNSMRVTMYSFTDRQLVKNESILASSEVGARTRSEIICPEHIKEYDLLFSHESLMEVAGNEVQKSCMLRIKGADGNYCWTLFTLQGIPKIDAHPNNLMIFQKNIEELKRKEELREQQLKDALNTAMAASEAKGTFMSRMSHEIRTPLNAVIGYMTIAKNSRGNAEKLGSCITKAEIAAKHLLSIINDVLDMSSIESGKLKIAHSQFDFKELVSNISAIFYTQTQEKNVKFETIATGISEEFLIGDKLRVNQILMNLLSNAVKFTPEGGNIYFTVEQTDIKDEKVYIKFIIADTGIGITPEFREKLFTPFEQQDASISQKYGGTGIGLSITKNLVTMMNGVIDVSSEVGCGTTFTVELPFEIDLSASRYNEHHDFSHLSALIVDDEQSACEYMHILMTRCGVKSEYALDGTHAVEMVSKAYKAGNGYDMCLMDWKMPDMDGVETIRRIRECVGESMPIIVVTAYDFSGIEEPAKGAGANIFISKPLFQSTLFDLLVNTYGKYKVEHPKQEEYDFKGVRLLLAEDNEMNREIAVDILEQYGFKVDCAVNGLETVDKFKACDTYSAILMDIQMPIMNGYEATKVIRELDCERAKTIPIIAMTANAFTEDIAASHAAGMDEHISKPIDIEQMLAILKKHIN